VNLAVAPKITGLGFKNTCDIRNKACSELLVWGERFADSETLKCHFDVYTVKYSIYEISFKIVNYLFNY
jgi:hypothetical protein